METLHSSVVAEGLLYGEGPRWHDGRLWIADQVAARVYTLGDDGLLDVAVEQDRPSGLGFTPDGRLLISMIRAPFIMRADADGLVVHHDLSHLGQACNDMVVLPDGTIYADLYPDTPVGPLPGTIALITPDGESRIVADGLKTPNGLAVTPDRSTLYASASLEGKVYAYTIQPDGGLADRRVFLDLGAKVVPDGLCLDEEGGVWIATFGSGEFVRANADGEITHRVETPGWWAVAVALGGEDGRTLYLVANLADGRGPEGYDNPRGRIEAVRVDVPGAGWP